MKKLGQLFLVDDEAPIFLPKEFSKAKAYSENTADKVDREVKRILEECLKEASDILVKHKDQLVKLAKELVLKETLTDKEVRELLGFEVNKDEWDLFAVESIAKEVEGEDKKG